MRIKLSFLNYSRLRCQEFLVLSFAISSTACTPSVNLGGTTSTSLTAEAMSPGSISILSGNNQTGSVGAPLPGLLIASVKDASGNKISGATVNWSIVSGGGSLSVTSTLTDSAGLANTLLILGTVPGASTVSASIPGTSYTTQFTVTSLPGSASQIAITSGTNQSGVVGSLLNTPLTATVNDSFGNLVSGASVNWAVVLGGGALSSGANSTNISGVTTNNLTLGTVSGNNLVSASLNGTSASVLISATATSGLPGVLSVMSGNNQTAPAGSALSPFGVTVTDSFGNPVVGATVTWAITSGSGTLSSSSNLTLAGGVSSSTLTLGAVPGASTITASTNGLTATFSVTGTLTASFQGWKNIQALGGRNPVSQSGLTPTSASVTLGWNAMTSTSGTIATYNIYRSTTSGSQNFSIPLASGITAASASYTDTAVAPNSTYYYVARPVIAGTVYSTPDVDTEIKIMVPPVNMSLIHRWMANYEMCTNLMGRTIDRTHNYRCPYIGPINQGGFYDFGQHQFWDTVGVGCNYTAPNATAALSCNDSTNGCLGVSNGAPGVSATTYAGQIWYDRGSANCYVASGGSWVNANSATAAQLGLMVSNQPGLPPLVQINQSQSQLACQQFNIAGLGTKRLPHHSEQVIAAAWPISMSDATIATIENGSSNNTTANCNSNNGSGLTYDNLATPANLETIPGSNASGDRAVRTGGTSTANCVSLYGIQDMVGNVWHWNSDQLNNCTGYTCNAASVSTVDPGNADWFWNNGTLPINFDGTIGPGGGTTQDTQWNFSAQSYNATDFLAPLGLPLVGSVASTYDSMAIGAGTGQFNPTRFHGNYFALYTNDGNATRGAIAGGYWSSGANSGRFTLRLGNSPGDTGNGIAASACILPLSN